MPGATMHFRELPPTARLQSVVACFWEFYASETVEPGHMHAIPVDGCTSITCGQGPARGKTAFVGPRLESLRTPVFPNDRYWGVRFLPGASKAAVGKSGRDWRDKFGLLAFEMPTLAAALADGLSRANSLEESVPVFENLIKPGPACPITMAGVYAITASHGQAKIADLPRQIGISERQFLRLFREEVGLTPKQFARICRFRAAAIDAVGSPGVNWAEVAADRGFTDQSHLIHEFNQLFGITPSEFESRFLAGIDHQRLLSIDP